MEGLQHLLKASKPEQVDSIIVDSFRYRHDGITMAKKKEYCTNLGITEAEADALFKSSSALVHKAVYLNVDGNGLAQLFPAGFHPNLQKLLSKLLQTHLAEWREAALQCEVSAPKLMDFDWRVDMKTSSNHLSRMSVPTVLVEMELQETPQRVHEMPGVRKVNFELSKETLTTMLDGLSKIRDQLGGMKMA